ncbi:MAG TPA: hypothetical protein VGK67_21935 [Myxococcales bacterium]|jgi:hypothetical protein
MKRTLALGAVLALTAVGCMRTMADPRKHSLDPVKLEGFDGVEDALGRLVLFRGTAYNARTGAIVVGDGLAVSCQGMEAWPEGLVGKKVTISGLFDRARAQDAEAVGGTGQVLDSSGFVLKHPKLE